MQPLCTVHSTIIAYSMHGMKFNHNLVTYLKPLLPNLGSFMGSRWGSVPSVAWAGHPSPFHRQEHRHHGKRIEDPIDGTCFWDSAIRAMCYPSYAQRLTQIHFYSSNSSCCPTALETVRLSISAIHNHQPVPGYPLIAPQPSLNFIRSKLSSAMSSISSRIARNGSAISSTSSRYVFPFKFPAGPHLILSEALSIPPPTTTSLPHTELSRTHHGFKNSWQTRITDTNDLLLEEWTLAWLLWLPQWCRCTSRELLEACLIASPSLGQTVLPSLAGDRNWGLGRLLKALADGFLRLGIIKRR